jgi:alkylhydroperoxidase/carboxymuconolactone decarboxylase family protein YurZ
MSPGTEADDPDAAMHIEEEVWPFPSERYLHEWAPGVLQAQNAWMASIDSLRAPDRKTHELIRMVCTVIARNEVGIVRHARLAREVGATWEEVLGSIMLTCVAFGVGPAVEAIPHARAGFDAAPEVEADDDE